MADFCLSQIVASSLVEDLPIGSVEIPTEVKLCIPEMFGPGSHCLLDIIVDSSMGIPAYVIVLQRKGISQRNGFWHLEHRPTCEVFLAKEYDYVPQSPESRSRFEDGQPLFKTPRALQAQGIHREEIGQVHEIDKRDYFPYVTWICVYCDA